MLRFSRIALIAVLFGLVPFAVAQEDVVEPPVETDEIADDTAQDTYQTAPDYSGDWLSWPKMTGDWGGARTDLANAGISIEIDYTQVFSDNMHGGKDTENALRASGTNDIELTLDTGKMGLWPGGMFIIHAESVWGGGIDKKVGSLIPTNLNAALPGSAEPGFGLDEGGRFLLSEWFYQQVLFEGKLILLGGKLWGARAFDANVFANNHETQFMNTALRNNPMIPSFLPYTTLGLGVIVNPTEWLSVLTAVADTDGRAKTTGFETGLHGDVNTTIIHEWAFSVEPFGLPGHQRVGMIWSCKDVAKVGPNEPFASTGGMAVDLLGPDLATKVVQSLATFDDGGDNIAIYYNMDQYLYVEENDPTQGVGVFGRFGWAREDVNPINYYYSLGVGAKGLIPERDKDTCGIGYYFIDLSNDLPPQFHSEQGIECYYNIEIAPWLHITPDLQVITNPGGHDYNDVSVVAGLRMHMAL